MYLSLSLHRQEEIPTQENESKQPLFVLGTVAAEGHGGLVGGEAVGDL